MNPPPGLPLATVQPPGWPRPSGYANGVRVPAGRDLVFVAGQIGWDEQQRITSGDFTAQFDQALANCVAVVEAAGGSAMDIVRLTVYCCDKHAYLAHLKQLGEIYRRRMGNHYTAMSVVEVRGLVEDGALVEIEATAALPVASDADVG